MRPTLVCMNEHISSFDASTDPTQKLSRVAAQVMMGATLLAGTVGLLAHGPIPLSADTHVYADSLTRLGLPHAANVLSHLPLLIVALVGCLACWGRRARAPMLAAWALFLALVALGALAGAAYHADPRDGRFLVVHAAIGSASCVLSLIFLAERLGAGFARAGGLALAALSGPLVCALGTGVADLRWALALQCLPVVLMPLVVWGLPSRGLAGSHWLVALVLYALAECAGVADMAIWSATAGTFAGMALSHLLLAACVGWLAYGAVRSSFVASAAVELSADCSSRATSASTAG